jgi:signal transduction histidine kinase
MSHRISLTQRAFLRLWIDDPQKAVDAFIESMRESGETPPVLRSVEQGETLLEEGSLNDRLHMVVKGRVVLTKTDESGRVIVVNRIRPGSLFGVMSFFTDEPTLTAALAETPVTSLILTRDEVEAMTRTASPLAPITRQLITVNLLGRYREVVDLNVKVESVNESLRQALDNLRSAHNRLVHQEKMATLGQLVAGVAHEINNPAAALQGSVRHLSEILPTLVGQDPAVRYFHLGLHTDLNAFTARAEERAMVRRLYPDLTPAEQRLVLNMSDDVRTEFDGLPSVLRSRALQLFDAGLLMKGAMGSTGRITALVASLKSYSRLDAGDASDIQLIDGIRDTLHILSNRLKRVEVAVEAGEVPDVKAFPAEMNQVWTNLIVNACDAMGDEGRLWIRVYPDDGQVCVEVHDSGPGIADEHLGKLFEPHFTTRNSSGHFGLGLGLTITRDIILKHSGRITPGRSDRLGGACFRVSIPA